MSWSESWKATGHSDPPRGFAFAAVHLFGKNVGFYCVHLKSNLVKHDANREQQLNILKREIAAAQLMKHVQDLQGRVLPSIKAVVVGGDFNTNGDQSTFVSEKTLDSLSSAGFRTAFPVFPPLEQRITHPGDGQYPDATFDYLFFKGAKPTDYKIVQTGVSDHLPLTCNFMIGD
ncbi:MAG: endonuclease/exonuclease/phosphatase family protein [Chthoniobacterales bacterium]